MIGQQTGNLMSSIAALCNAAGLCVVKGQLYKAKAIYQRALELATDNRGHMLPIAGRALMGLGELAREWNDLEAATHYLTRSLEQTQQWGGFGTLVCYLTLARVKVAQGDFDQAGDLIQRARQLAIQTDVSDMDDALVAVSQVRLWIAQGNIEAAQSWARQRGLDADTPAQAESPPFHELRQAEVATLARVYLASEQPDEALQVLEPLLQVAEKLSQTKRTIEFLALQSLALSQTPSKDNTEKALAQLERALSLAEPESYVRVFVDEGPAMAALLRQATVRGIAPGYVSTLLDAFGMEKGERVKAKHQPLVEPLSERELDVLKLLATSLSIPEIAQELFISASTVRSHTKSIYGKLDVHSRMQAIEKARELEILD